MCGSRRRVALGERRKLRLMLFASQKIYLVWTCEEEVANCLNTILAFREMQLLSSKWYHWCRSHIHESLWSSCEARNRSWPFKTPWRD